MSTTMKKDDSSEQNWEVKLRPRNFNEFIGQKNIVENISIMVDSAKIRQSALDHILLSVLGTRKNLTCIFNRRCCSSQLHVISGPRLKKDLAAILTNLNRRRLIYR